jgi:uncharacterized protein (DUF1778 family)
MATKKQGTHAKLFSLLIREDRAAEDTLLDQTLVKVDAKSYQHYLGILDQPPSGEGFARLMNAPKPWRD